MSDPLLRSMRHTPPPAESASIGEALLVQAVEAVRSVTEDLHHIARYRNIESYPSATNLQEVRMLDEDWTLAVIVVACPTAQVDGAGSFIKSAFEGTVAEHRKAGANSHQGDPE